MDLNATNEQSTNADLTLAFHALAWTVADPSRGGRLLSLTGLDPQQLRARAAEPALLGAVIGFLAAHEPDLVACAEAIGSRPADLVALRERLERA